MTVLKTERLTLRPMHPGDAEAYAAMRYHPAVAKWLSAAPADPVDAAHAAIERYAQSWRDRGYGPWALFRDGRLIGHAGLNFVPEFGETEVLWSLHPDAWGQGLATEAGRAALDFGFRTLGLRLIFAVTKPDNQASQAVMTRLGLIYRKDVVYRDVESVWFDIDATRWRG
jgi:RimJ/RimL family protein N-acetyltransferase